jgi:hypothetical protein
MSYIDVFANIEQYLVSSGIFTPIQGETRISKHFRLLDNLKTVVGIVENSLNYEKLPKEPYMPTADENIMEKSHILATNELKEQNPAPINKLYISFRCMNSKRVVKFDATELKFNSLSELIDWSFENIEMQSCSIITLATTINKVWNGDIKEVLQQFEMEIKRRKFRITSDERIGFNIPQNYNNSFVHIPKRILRDVWNKLGTTLIHTWSFDRAVNIILNSYGDLENISNRFDTKIFATNVVRAFMLNKKL